MFDALLHVPVTVYVQYVLMSFQLYFTHTHAHFFYYI